MFIGMSKNIGGFRVGMAVNVKELFKNSSNKDIKKQEFQAFLEKVQNDIKESLFIFYRSKGLTSTEIAKLTEDTIPLEIKESSDYQELNELYEKLIKETKKIIYAEDNGVVAKRKISSLIIEIKDFVEKNYSSTINEIKEEEKLNALNLQEEEKKRKRKKIKNWTIGIIVLLVISNIIEQFRNDGNLEDKNKKEIILK